MRTGLPLREITTKELYKEIQQLRQELLNHNHLTSGSQQLTGEVTGILQSPNFITGSSGWQLLPDGTLEANTGTFRGDISGASGTFTGDISGATITGSTFKTAASGQRIEISDNPNNITYYSASATEGILYPIHETDYEGMRFSGKAMVLQGADPGYVLTIPEGGSPTHLHYFSSNHSDSTYWLEIGVNVPNGGGAGTGHIHLNAGAIKPKTANTTDLGGGSSYPFRHIAYCGTMYGYYIDGEDTTQEFQLYPGSTGVVLASTPAGSHVMLNPKDELQIYHDSSLVAHFDETGLVMASGKTISGEMNVESFTTGEAITAGDVVCLKSEIKTVYPNENTYTKSTEPNSNFNTAEVIHCSKIYGEAGNCQGWLEVPTTGVPSSSDILRATLYLYCRQCSGSGDTVTLQRPTETWDYTTLTYNTHPAVASDMGTLRMSQDQISVTDTGLWSWDITQFFRQYRDANYIEHFGLNLLGGNSETISFDSSNATTPGNVKPYIEIETLINSDNKIYKADATDYLTSRFIVGIALETKGADETCKVQVLGAVAKDGLGYAGNRFYLSETAGEITRTSDNIARIVYIGSSLTTSKLLLQPQTKDIFIEKNSHYGGNLIISGMRIYAPADASYAVLDIESDNSYPTRRKIRVYKDSDGDKTVVMQENSGGASYIIDLTATWSNNYITLTKNSGVEQRLNSISFYT